MKLHLPKLLRNALLACMAAVVSHGAYALTFTEHMIDTSMSYSANGISYNHETGMITGLSSASLVLTINLNELAKADGDQQVVYIDGSAQNWGFNTYKYTPEGAEGAVVGLTGYWEPNSNNGRWTNGGEVTLEELTGAKVSEEDTSVDMVAAITRNGTFMYAAKDLSQVYGAGGLKEGTASNPINGVYVNKNIVSSVLGGVTVANGDNTWTKTYGSVSTGIVPTLPVDATILSNQILTVGKNNSGNVNAYAGDIIVGGSGQLFLQTWNTGGAFSLTNDLYLGATTGHYIGHNGAPAGCALTVGCFSGAVDVLGDIHLVENATIWKEAAKADSRNALSFRGDIVGENCELTTIQWDVVNVYGALNLKTLNVGEGCTGTKIFGDASIETVKLHRNSDITFVGDGVRSIGRITTDNAGGAGGSVSVTASGALKTDEVYFAWGKTLNVDGLAEIGNLMIRNNSTLSGMGSIKAKKLTLENWSTNTISAKEVLIGSGGVLVQQGSMFNLSTTIHSVGAVNLSQGELNINGVAYMEGAADTYSDGENGFYTGNTYIAIQSDDSISINSAAQDGFTIKIDGVAAESGDYTLSTDRKQLTVTYGEVGNKGGLYHVNTTASASDAIAGTENFLAYSVKKGATLNIEAKENALSAVNAKSALCTAQGTGTINFKSDLTLDNGATVGFRGDVVLTSGKTLTLGASNNNSALFNMDFAVNSLQLNGAQLTVNYTETYIKKVQAKAANSKIFIFDFSAASYQAGAAFGIGTLEVDADMQLELQWKSRTNIGVLTGDSQLQIVGCTSNASQGAEINIGSFEQFTGDLVINCETETNFVVNGTIKETESLDASRLSVAGQNTRFVLHGAGAFNNGSSLALAEKVFLGEDWSGTVGVNGVTVDGTVDASSLVTSSSSLVITDLTVADGGALTLGGAVTLGGTMNLAETVENNGTLTFASDVKFDLTGMEATSSDVESVYHLFSAGDLSSLTADNLTDTFKTSLGAGTWAFKNDGTLVFTADANTDTLIVTEDNTVYVADAEKTKIALNGGTLVMDKTALLDTVESLEVTTSGGSLKGSADGTVQEVAFDTATVNGKLTIADGGTDITVKLESFTISEGGSIEVAAGQKLDISAHALGGWGTAIAPMTKLLQGVEGDGTVIIGDGWWANYQDFVETGIEFGVNIEALEAFELDNRGSGDLTWTVGKNLTVRAADDEDDKTGDLRIDGAILMKVVDGGSITVDGKISYGHTDTNSDCEIELESGAEIKADSMVVVKDLTGENQAHRFTMTGGTLELTGEGGIDSRIATTISGGTLKTGDNSWGITGGRVGGVSIVNSTVGEGESAHTGTGTITLTNATLTGTINNDGGKLALSGTVILDDTDGAFQTQTTNTRYSADTETLKGNGFQIVDKVYQVVTDASKLDVIGVTGSWMVGTSEGTYADGYVTLAGVSTDQTYWIGNGEVTYSDIKGAKNGENEGISTIALYKNGENTGSLVWDETASDIAIQAKATTTLTLNGAGVVLNRDQVTVDSGKTLTLSGNGVYDLGTVTNLGNGITIPNALKVNLGGEWKGTVRVSGTIDTAHLNKLGNKDSWIQIDGLSGKGRHNVSSGVELTGAGYTITGYTETEDKFSGAVKGSADFTIKSADGNAMKYIFSGNTAEWSGGFVVAQHESTATPTVSVELTGGDDVFASGAKGIEMNRAGTLNVTIGNTTKATTMNGDISKVADATLNLTTVGEVTMAGTLADGIGLTNNGTLELTQDAATLASLAGTGSVTAKSLTLTGAATDRTGITADSLTLQGASNTVGDLTLTGALTLGADVTSLNAGELNITGNMVVNKLSANLISSTGLADGASLKLSIEEAVLREAITAKGLTSLVIGTITDLDIAKVTLNGDTTFDVGQYTFSINNSAADGVIELIASANGHTWGGNENDPADNSNWSEGLNWKEGIAPGGTSDTQAVKFLGAGSSKVVIGNSMTIEYITVDIDGYTPDSETLTDSDPKKVGYTFTATEGTNWNVLTVEESLSVNKGLLNVGSNVNIEAEKRVEVLEAGELRIAEKAFVNAYAGIENAGKVTIDASTSPENHGALFVQGGGSVTNAGTMKVNGTLLAGYGLIHDHDGSNINNSGVLVNKGTVVADGNLTNSGTLSQESGSLKVMGELINAAAGSAEVPAGEVNITGGTVEVGTMANGGAMDLSGATVDIIGTVYEDEDEEMQVIAPKMENKAGASLNIIGGATVSVKDLVLNSTTTYECGAVNSGEITIGTAAEGETAATTGGLTVQGQLENTATGSIYLVNGTLSIEDTLQNEGEITISGGTAEAATVDNDASMTVSGGSLTADAMDNSGTLTIVGGSVTVGEEDATGTTLTNSGTITIGTAAEGETPATTGSLVVNGDLANSGADNNIVVNDKSTLTVTGNLNAADMDLGFEGKVTVGGTATMDNLTIEEGAEFTAENAEIKDTLDNDGKLTVTTTKDETTGEITGGKLTIGTLMGGGEVHVEEGGALSIGSSVDFTGVLDNKGSMEFTAADAVVTLKNAQEAGHTAGDLTAAGIKLTADAIGSVVDGKETSYQMGAIKTDVLTVSDVKASAPRVTMDSLDAKTDGGKIKLVITDIEDKTMTSGSAHLITLENEMDGGIFAEFDLGNYGYTGDGSYDKNAAAVQEDYMQNLLKAGNRVYFTDTDPAATTALLAGGTSNVYVSIDKVQEDENVWNVGNDMTESGLTVIKDGKLVSDDILDNVQKTVVAGEQTIDLTGGITKVKLNGLTALGDDSVLDIEGDGSADTATLKGEYTGVLNLKGVTADMDLKGTTVMAEDDTVVLKGTIEDGMLEVQQDSAAQGDGLELNDTTLRVVIDSDFNTLDDATLAGLENSIVNVGGTETDGDIEIGTYNADGDFIASAGYAKYFDMSTIFIDPNGNVVADRNTSYFSDNFTAESANGEAGMTLADAALLKLNPQMDKDSALGAMLTAIENAGTRTEADELAASLAGASSAVLGMAVSGDVDRQLRAIRNRTTTMGVDQSVANEDMPYFNAWINAEGAMNELSDNGTEGGYKLNSWGGTVGFDVDVCPTFTAGMAFTAMYGDLDVTGADTATGDLDTYYLSAFARYSESAWTHTFVATVGTGDISMKRTVLGSEQKVETDALSFGLMYEVGRVFALDEDGSACLQPVFNVTWKHTTVDGYTEDGSDLALKVDEQTVDTVTFGLGARLQAVVGESMYNRTSIFEARVLAKADVGDRNGSADVALAGLPGHKAEVESAEMGAFGLEAGAGLTIPVGEEGGSIFMDASVELRSDYTDVNGTVGYRINF